MFQESLGKFKLFGQEIQTIKKYMTCFKFFFGFKLYYLSSEIFFASIHNMCIPLDW